MNITSKSSVVYSFIVFKFVSFIIWKDFYRENGLIFLGNWGEATLVLRIWGTKENYFQGAEDFFSRLWGDQCIIFRDQRSTDPPCGLITMLHWPTNVYYYCSGKE